MFHLFLTSSRVRKFYDLAIILLSASLTALVLLYHVCNANSVLIYVINNF